jgi:hypothetical protein
VMLIGTVVLFLKDQLFEGDFWTGDGMGAGAAAGWGMTWSGIC